MRFASLFFILLVSCATFEHLAAKAPLFGGYSVEIVENQRIHLLRLDLSDFAVKPIKAHKLETPTKLAIEHDAVAAINGGFFQEDGTPAGLLVLEKKVVGYQGKPRAALGWSANNDAIVIDRITYTSSQKEFVSTTGLTSAKDWKAIDFAIGGTPLLIRNYQIIEDFSAEKVRDSFLSLKHARTAICVQDIKHWILVVVEGSSSLELSPFGRSGFTMPELARFMANVLNCMHAINLDGGGSTALVIHNELMNATTFEERAVSDVVGVFERTPSPKHLN